MTSTLNATIDVCTCGDICNCDVGMPESGPELLALYESGRDHFQAQITLGNIPAKLKSAVAVQLRKLDMLIRFEHVKAEMRAEMGVSA